jgi:Uncharacterized protein conserved in bacteria (DUF2252)
MLVARSGQLRRLCFGIFWFRETCMVLMPHGTLAERYEHGRRLRRKVPREEHADLRGPTDRNAVAILAATDRTRVPELVPIRYERMLANPFAFLRGAAAVMAEDLRDQPSTGVLVQACGDCHLMNFGAFATPEQNILFDINDFDETLPGVDFTADLKRLAASVAVAALAANLSKKRARAIGATTVEAYRSRTRNLARLSPLEIWHSRIVLTREIERIEDRALQRELQSILTKARDYLAEDDNFPHLIKGKRARIEDRPPLIYHFAAKGDTRHHIDAKRALDAYTARLPPDRLCLVDRYALKDVAFKVVGVAALARSAPLGSTRVATARRCSCRSRKPENRCSNGWHQDSRATRVSGRSRVSASCRRQATSSWAGPRTSHRTDISTCAN